MSLLSALGLPSPCLVAGSATTANMAPPITSSASDAQNGAAPTPHAAPDSDSPAPLMPCSPAMNGFWVDQHPSNCDSPAPLTPTSPAPTTAPMNAVWMYQHPSNCNTWREYDKPHADLLEQAYLKYIFGESSEHQVVISCPRLVRLVVSVKQPMEQYSPANGITRRVRRFLERVAV